MPAYDDKLCQHGCFSGVKAEQRRYLKCGTRPADAAFRQARGGLCRRRAKIIRRASGGVKHPVRRWH